MTNIVLTDLTNGRLNTQNDWIGTGVFDKLVNAVNKNIEAQYNKGRITGPEYANVYLGSMQFTIGEAMQYLLQKQRVEAEIDHTLKSTEVLEQQRLNLINENDKLYAEIALLQEQVTRAKKEYDLLLAQIAHLNKQDAQIDQAIAKLKAETDNTTEQKAVIVAQKDKLNADTALVEAKAKEQKFKNGNGVFSSSVPAHQIAVLQAQKDLYSRQEQAFDDNKKQKLLDAQLNAYSMIFSDAQLSTVPSGVLDNQALLNVFKSIKI